MTARAKTPPGAFRESLARREVQRDRFRGNCPLPTEGVTGLLAQPDGALVVTALPGGFHASHGLAHGNVARTTTSRVTAQHVALTDVKIGGTTDSAQLHARLGEGRHAGVELRAIDRDGKVHIELVALDAPSERALRAELAQVRESLRARGLDSVSVDVRSNDGGAPHEGHEAPEPEVTVPGESAVATAPGPEVTDRDEPSTIVL